MGNKHDVQTLQPPMNHSLIANYFTGMICYDSFYKGTAQICECGRTCCHNAQDNQISKANLYVYHCYHCQTIYCIGHFMHHILLFKSYIVHHWKHTNVAKFNTTTKAKQYFTINEINQFADSISVGGKIFIMGGCILDTVHKVNFANSMLIDKQSMICKKYAHSLCHLDTLIYSIGGYDRSFALNDCEKYDITANGWSLLPPLNIARFYCAAFIWRKYAFALCGDTGSYFLSSIERLKLSRCTQWEIINANFPFLSRYGAHGVSIGDGVLLFGGL